MTHLVLALVSMLALGLLAWVAGRVSRLPVCPVCVGVAGTWLWMLAARLGGFAIDTVILGILLGASVVGVAQWVETRITPGRLPLLWKAIALPTGFAAAYGLVAERWVLAIGAAAALGFVALVFLRPRRAGAGDPEAVAHLEERMKQCC